MGKVFGLIMRKGGVGKTTSANTLAVQFALHEDRDILSKDPTTLQGNLPVLAIDMDTQSNLSNGLGIELDRWKRRHPGKTFTSTYEVLLNPEYGVAHARYHTAYGIDVVPAVAAMSGVESELSNAIQRENRLAIALRAAGTEKFPVPVQAVDQWKWIVVDSPPSLSVLTLNVLAAVDYVLIPVEIGDYALGAVPEVIAAVDLVRRINRNLRVGGIFCTKYDARNNLSRKIEAEIRQRFGSLVFETVIPLNTKIAEAPTVRQPIQVYAPPSSSAQAYAQLAQEIMEKCR